MKKHRTPAARAQKGETLAEVLVALLIVALAALLMASMVTVSAHMNTAAREKDKAFYAALQTVEDKAVNAPTPDATGNYMAIYDKDGNRVGSSYNVNVYTEGGITLYKQP